ncbi:MAG: hypothetical protein M1828_004977 [Chrysothrix sp. TS-e1954]|nr:MAG: hypothetical protein M1828_004977 [Chrysothrix sp. TS-e1954]
MASLLVTMWLAAREPSIRTPTFKLYSTALALLASVGPYKSFVLKPLEGRMNERSLTSSSEELEREISYDSTSLREFIQSLWSRQEADEKQMNMHQLADRWGWLNLGMAGMIMASAVCSAYGMAQEELSFFE